MSLILGSPSVWSSGNSISSGFSKGNNITWVHLTLSYFQCIFVCMSILNGFFHYSNSSFQCSKWFFSFESLIQYCPARRHLLVISHNTEVSKSFPVTENYLHCDLHNFHLILSLFTIPASTQAFFSSCAKYILSFLPHWPAIWNSQMA